MRHRQAKYAKQLYLNRPQVGFKVTPIGAKRLESAVHVLQVADHGVDPVVIHRDAAPRDVPAQQPAMSRTSLAGLHASYPSAACVLPINDRLRVE